MADQPRGWSPFRGVDRFKKDFDDLFDRFLGGRTARDRSLVPMIESFSERDTVVVRVDLPGIKLKDVEVTATGDQLTIRGTREREKEERGRDFIYREVSYGSFERTIRLPAGIRSEDIKASYRNGVLEVTAPIIAHGRTRKIPIELEGKRSGDSS